MQQKTILRLIICLHTFARAHQFQPSCLQLCARQPAHAQNLLNYFFPPQKSIFILNSTLNSPRLSNI